MSHLFHEPFEPALYARYRPFANGYAASLPSGLAFALHSRLAVTLAAFPEEAWSDQPAWRPRRFGGIGYPSLASPTGYTGRGDDPYADAGLAATPATGFAADPNQAVAVRITGTFTGKSASRLG